MALTCWHVMMVRYHEELGWIPYVNWRSWDAAGWQGPLSLSIQCNVILASNLLLQFIWQCALMLFSDITDLCGWKSCMHHAFPHTLSWWCGPCLMHTFLHLPGIWDMPGTLKPTTRQVKDLDLRVPATNLLQWRTATRKQWRKEPVNINGTECPY